MKKITLLALLLCLTIVSNAQEYFPKMTEQHVEDHNSKVFVGGAVSLWSNPEEKEFKLDLCPEVGYLFNENWGVGILLGYEHEKEKENKTNSFKLSPFARWYYVHKGPFNLFLDGGVGFDWGKIENAGEKSNRPGFELGIRPGACVDLTEGLCLCLRMGFMGYRNNYHGGEEPHIGTTGFGLRFAPEELMIGLELEL